MQVCQVFDKINQTCSLSASAIDFLSTSIPQYTMQLLQLMATVWLFYMFFFSDFNLKKLEMTLIDCMINLILSSYTNKTYLLSASVINRWKALFSDESFSSLTFFNSDICKWLRSYKISKLLFIYFYFFALRWGSLY